MVTIKRIIQTAVLDLPSTFKTLGFPNMQKMIEMSTHI